MSKSNDSSITVIDLWRLCIRRWKWFVVSFFVCLLFAVRYILTAPYLYTRSASIMVREDAIGSNATDKNSKEFSDIGFVKQKNKISDVVRHMTSLDVLMEVAKRRTDSLSDHEAFVVASAIQKRFKAEGEGGESNIIDLTYQDSSTSEAERVLMLILNVYNEKWILDKQKMIQSTSLFIDSKLKLLERDLNIVDDSISSYKSRNGITEIENVSDIYLRQQSEADAQILKLMNQKAMAQYIRSLLEDESSQQRLLLVNSGINNTLIESQITLYNNLLLQMQSHMEYTSGQNPLMMNLEKELNSLRKNIHSNVVNHIRTIDIQLQSLKNYHSETASKISSKPKQAKHLISIEREQKVKESLYLYLLQKKEENEISLTYQYAPTRIIDIPHGSGKPTSPKRPRVLIAAMIFGFMIPLVIIFFGAIMDESVRDRFDIERRNDILFLGEVPLTSSKSTLRSLQERFLPARLLPEHLLRKRFLKKRFVQALLNRYWKKSIVKPIVVGDGKQDNVNEAFRIIRTRLEVANNSHPGQHVYLVTSSESGTGKTFVAMNLALALALTKKRVLFIDGDLRKGTASHIWKTPPHGLSDYLDGRVIELDYIFFQPQGFPTLDVLPSGTTPPNPTELLNGNQFCELIRTLRSQYDYIIVDTPQASNLADAEIIGKHTDSTLHIIRAGVFKRSDLDNLKGKENKARNQYVVLNGVHIGSRYGKPYDYAT